MVGKLPSDLTADAVTVSHNHGDHNYVKGVSGQPQVLDQAGHFNVNEFDIKGVAAFHDNQLGQKRGADIVYVIRAENLTLCHLGDLGHALTKDQLAEIGPVDILMIPAGGFFTIEPNEAVEVVNQIQPKLVLPMHYQPKKSLIPSPLVPHPSIAVGQRSSWSARPVSDHAQRSPATPSISFRALTNQSVPLTQHQSKDGVLATVDKFTQFLGWEVNEVDELVVDRAKLDLMPRQTVIFKR